VSFVYDHHRRDLLARLAHLQHEHLDLVVATTHVHLDHARGLEVLILRGPARRVQALGDQIASTRGVERAEVSLTAVGAAGGARDHAHDHDADGDHDEDHDHHHDDDHDHAHHGPAWHVAAHAHEASADPVLPRRAKAAKRGAKRVAAPAAPAASRGSSARRRAKRGRRG
jgi:hypothetical protein